MTTAQTLAQKHHSRHHYLQTCFSKNLMAGEKCLRYYQIISLVGFVTTNTITGSVGLPHKLFYN